MAVTKHSQLTDVSTPHAAADLATDSVTTAKITALAVTGAKIAADTIPNSKLTPIAPYIGVYDVVVYELAVYGEGE